jgi:ribosomal subunit interface protein
MNIKTKATNLDLSDAVSQYLFKRLESTNKFTQGVDPDSIMIEVELARTTRHHKSGDIFKAEYNFCIGGDCMRAVAENADLYSAIDEAKDELMRQLRKRKRKRMAGIRRGGQKIKNLVRGFFRRNNDSY